MSNGKFILAKDFIPSTIVSVTSESGNRLKGNMLEYTRPFKIWAASDINTQIVLGKFGSSVSDVRMFMNNLNFPNLIFQADVNTLFSSPFVSTITVNKDYVLDRRKGYFDFTNVATFVSLEWFRFIIPSQAVDNSEVRFKLGAVTFINTFVELDRNPTLPFSMNMVDNKTYNREVDTGAIIDVLVTGQKYIKFNSSFLVPNTPAALMRQKMYNYFAHVGSSPTLLYFNRGNTEEAYLVRKVGDIEENFVENTPKENPMSGFILEETVYG